MTVWGYVLIAGALLLAAGAILYYRGRTRRILDNLSRMLDIAMQGTFTEDSFDESMLSALESRLAHYLAASTVSSRNVAAEKEKLKTLIGDISHQTKTPDCQHPALYPAPRGAALEPGLSGCFGGADKKAPKPY